jgi:hypothetical protein
MMIKRIIILSCCVFFCSVTAYLVLSDTARI